MVHLLEWVGFALADRIPLSSLLCYREYQGRSSCTWYRASLREAIYYEI